MLSLTDRCRARLVPAALAALVVACGAPGEKLPAPNVVLIVIDCLRADHVSAYGYHRPTTPNLDALAAEGTLFEAAFSQAHWTRPSVPSLLTGLYPTEHGLIDVGRSPKGEVRGQRLAPEAQTVAEDLQAAGYSTALIGEQFQLARSFGLDQGFDLYLNRGGKAPLINRKLRRWLDERESTAPFFVYLHYLDAHWPYCPSGRFRGRFDTGESTLNTCAGRRLRDEIRSGARPLTHADLERLRARYDEELLSVDAALGGLFADLEERGQWKDSLVIVTADHGEEFMEHGSIGHNTGVVDVLLSVPLIVKRPDSWPGTPQARVTDLVELRSVAATVRAAAGLDAGTGGPSLLPYLLGRPAPDPPPVIVAESAAEILVRSASHSLLISKEDGSMRLYDRSVEALETTDVLDAEPDVAGRLRRHARAWREGLTPVEAPTADVDGETVEGLRALGYID